MSDKELMKKQETETVANAERTRSCNCFLPLTDISEDKDAIYLVAEMPGVDKNAVDITLEKDLLTIQGVVNEEAVEKHSLLSSEFETGDYYRAFRVGDVIDRDKIDAKFENGVLYLTLHKAAAVKAQKINIS